jgi:hypothetical protein
MNVRLLVLSVMFLSLSGEIASAYTFFPGGINPAIWTDSAFGFIPSSPPGQTVTTGCTGVGGASGCGLPSSANVSQMAFGSSASAQAVVSGVPVPDLNVNALAETPTGTGMYVIPSEAAASALFTFYFSLDPISPSAPRQPLVDFVGNITQSTNGNIYSVFSAQELVTTQNLTTNGVTYDVANGPGNFTSAIPVLVGDNYSVTMDASVDVIGSGSAQATIDPLIQIDPSCNCSQDFAIEISYVMSNTSAVPEASTWVMLLLGFTGFGFKTYLRRTAAA